MPRFRKKPVVIEAIQFSAIKPLPDGVKYDTNGFAVIPTLEGEMQVTEGDWVITGVKGERYPCKPDIFEATYEPAE